MNITANVERGPMTRFQVTAILICMIINMIDGFDVLVIAFAAPSIASDWQLSSTELGVLLSSGLLGMALGSLILGPLADRFGRRWLILGCLMIISAGMLVSGLSQGLAQLTAMRFLTGLGVGGILPGLNTIVSEYSSLRWRSFWVSLLQTGYPIGAMIGGMLTALLIAQYGWRAAFFFGAFASLCMIPLVWRFLPESLDFLLSSRPAGALEKVNDVLGRLGREKVTVLPERAHTAIKRRIGYADLLAAGELRMRTVLLCLSFFVVMLTFYFVMSWTPKILVDSGMSAAQGISGGIILNLGGIIGCVFLGFLSSRWPLPRIITLYVVLTFLLMIVFAQLSSQVATMVTIAVILGFFLFGCMVGLYALAPQLYPVQSRSAGISIGIGFGRMGGVLSPMLAGVLFDLGWAKTDGYILFALPLVITATAIVMLGRAMRRSEA